MVRLEQPQSDLLDWLILSLTPQVGPKTGLRLIKAFGSINNVFQQNINILAQFSNPRIAKLILDRSSLDIANKMLDWVNINPNHHIIPITDKRYPKELATISDPPLVLYLMGNLELLKNPKIAIIGTKNPTKYGITNAFRFAKALASKNLTIVSGMSPGIDTHAHLGSLQTKGSTIAVLGTGFNSQILKSQQELYNNMLSLGLFITEFPIDNYNNPINFEKRNRIISGLSKACLVVESGLDSEALITANYALEMGREVMAIPGSIDNPSTRGCHRLIKSGAKLVETINDILEEIQLTQYKSDSLKPQDNLLSVMGKSPITIDALCSKLNIEYTEICAKLLELELGGQIINCGNGHYQQIFC